MTSNRFDEQSVCCPYCGEPITAFVDPGNGEAEYIDDCTVCCRPIVHRLRFEASGSLVLEVRRDDD